VSKACTSTVMQRMYKQMLTETRVAGVYASYSGFIEDVAKHSDKTLFVSVDCVISGFSAVVVNLIG